MSLSSLHHHSPLARILQVHKPPRGPAVVAFTGSGGKTTCAWELAHAAAEAGLRVVVTTTTRMGPDERLVDLRDVPALLTNPPQPGSLQLLGRLSDDGRKMLPPPPEVFDALLESEAVDLLVVEADGSRGASLKGYKPDEPVLPARVDHVVVVLGVDALHATLTSPLIHRATLLWERLALPTEASMDASTVTRALFEQPAYLASCSRTATWLLLNKVDRPDDLHAARTLCEALLPSVQASPLRGLLWRGQALPGQVEVIGGGPPGDFCLAVLAAGASTRFGGVKQLALLGGKPLLGRVVDACIQSSANSVVVVTGAHAAAAQDALLGLMPNARLTVVSNDDHAQGMSSSLRCALRQVGPSSPGLLVTLGDMPWIDVETINRVLAAARCHPRHILVPTYKGQSGHPVYFPRRFFDELDALRGDRGGASVLKRHPDAILEVPIAHDGILRDIDRREDLASQT